MDRRQRKTREAIFSAFTQLLSQKDFSKITVGEVIDLADVGRATFYAHFETKDSLLSGLCRELFCHITDGLHPDTQDHRHIFTCPDPGDVFLHLLRHLQTNDHHILDLLSGRNRDLFLPYFQKELRLLVADQQALFADRKDPRLPESFWLDHIAACFTQTVRWWVQTGMDRSPETVAEFFFLSV